MQTEAGTLSELDAAQNAARINGRWFHFSPEQQFRHLRVGDPVEVTFAEQGDRRKAVEIKLLPGESAIAPALPPELAGKS